MLLDMRRNAFAAFGLIVTLTACGGSDGGAASAPGRAGDAVSGEVAEDTRTDGEAGAASELTRAATLGREQVRTGTVTVRTDDVPAAARTAVRVTEDEGGFLESEDTKDDRTTMTLRIPPARFTTVGDALAKLGTVTARTVSTEDVTGDVADVEGRLAAARASAQRVRALLGRASSISEITKLESELTSRESDLESLETRRRALAGRTSYAAITVTFVPPTVVAAKADAGDAGFGDGLRSGWRVFVTTVNGLLVALGALLPFLVTGAVVGVPAWLVHRRRVTARA